MASLSVFVILGAKKPLVVELTSNCAAAFGVAVPIPIWAFTFVAMSRTTIRTGVKIDFFMLLVSIYFLWIVID
jgi:hypothetical protein